MQALDQLDLTGVVEIVSRDAPDEQDVRKRAAPGLLPECRDRDILNGRPESVVLVSQQSDGVPPRLVGWRVGYREPIAAVQGRTARAEAGPNDVG